MRPGDRIIAFTPRYNERSGDSGLRTRRLRWSDEKAYQDRITCTKAKSDVDAIDFVPTTTATRCRARRRWDDRLPDGLRRTRTRRPWTRRLQYIPASKMVIGFEPGLQADTGVSGGVEHEKAMIILLNGKVGGIMFWAVNEGARAPNGKTTGEDSVALANYAAAL